MAEKQQVALYPDPPPFYKHFTKQNLARLHQLRRSEETNGQNGEALPNELQFLIPPAPPEATWKSFGVEHSLEASDPTLSESGVEQLYPDHPSVKLAPQEHLIALARSLLTTFLSLCGILAQNPALYESKIQDLRTMAINMHALINEYRPHQARESLTLLIEERIATLRAEITAIGDLERKMTEQSSQIQEQVRNDSTEQITNAEVESNEASDGLESQRELWAMLAEFDGSSAQNSMVT